MSSKLNIKKNVVTTVTAFFINILLTFIGYRLVVEQGGLTALGVWSVLSAAIFIIRIGDVGMGNSAERHVAMVSAQTDSQKARGYLDTALVINTALFSFLALIGWLIFSYKIEWIVPAESHLQAEALHILPLMLAVFVISNIANVISGALRGLHLAYMSAYLSVAGALLQMFIIVLLVPKFGIAGLAWGQLAQNIFIAIAAWYLFNHHLSQYGAKLSIFPVEGSKSLFRELFNFSIRAQAVNLVNGLFEPVSKFIIGHSVGMSTLGLYEIAYKLVALPRNAVVSGVLGLTPAITRLLISDPQEAERLYFRARRLVLLATGGVMLLVVLSSPLLSFLLLTEIDKLLIAFVTTLAIGFWLNALGAPAYTLGFSAGQMQANLISSILCIACVVLLSAILRIFWPVYGPVLASACALSLGGLFILWRNEKILKEYK
ncbi:MULTISPECIES: MATE family efflux transporter [Acinetobacter]|uniref:MATE family efflux transporter n=1 Tax=Acinetobacter TaxID=469 RepID=UPI0025C257EF|nr:MATE family efflux transporter [Acinetobacter sp. UBA3025]